MHKIITVALTILFISCTATKSTSQSKLSSILDTEKHAGIYTYGNALEQGAVGYITVFPETNNTLLFHISLNLGPKSYNSGTLYGRITIKDGKGTFNSPEYTNCKWGISIIGDTLKITTIDDNFSCGFGHNVTAGGIYTRKDKTKPAFFEDMVGQKVFFAKTSPKDYYKE